MDRSAITWGAWSGIAAIIFFSIGIGPLCADFLPPPSPEKSAEQIASLFRNNANGIRLGCILITIGASLFCAYFAAIAAAMRRMEQGFPVLTYTMIISSAMATVPFFLVAMAWALAAFRPERPDDTIRLMSDLGWICLVLPVFSGVVQLISLALAIFWDRSANPFMDRWVAYLSLWVSLLFMPGAMIVFFKAGPFAWNGVLAFWVGLSSFTVWIIGVTYALLKGSKRLEPTILKSPT